MPTNKKSTEIAEAIIATPSAPTMEEWKRLYEVAAPFRELGPWEWMYDNQLFGVQNPETGEIGYCSVMGNLGELFAIAVFRDLEGFYEMQERAMNPLALMMDSFSLLEYQDCIMASFEDREAVEEPDRAVMKTLGLRFRGRGAWPLFRSYVPGYAPWFIEGSEARFLIHALEQAVDVATRLKDNPDLFPDVDETGLYLVRRCEQGPEGLVWRDETEPAVQNRKPEPESVPVDEAAVAPLRSLPRTNGILEIDLFRLPEPIQEEKNTRPVLPYLIIAAAAPPQGSKKKGKQKPALEPMTALANPLVGTRMASPDTTAEETLAVLLEALQQLQCLPEEVVVQRQEAFTYLEEVTKSLEIRLTLADETPTIDEAKAFMMAFMGGGFPF